jgi:hypothetical protein
VHGVRGGGDRRARKGRQRRRVEHRAAEAAPEAPRVGRRREGGRQRQDHAVQDRGPVLSEIIN